MAKKLARFITQPHGVDEYWTRTGMQVPAGVWFEFQRLTAELPYGSARHAATGALVLFLALPEEAQQAIIAEIAGKTATGLAINIDTVLGLSRTKRD